jgi:hypothetical protein
VTSGYVGYGQYGGAYGAAGYGGYGQNMFPGASPEMMWIEQAGRQSYMLPPLGEATSPQVSANATAGSLDSGGIASCPLDRMPVNQAEQVACIRKDLNEVLRAHKP